MKTALFSPSFLEGHDALGSNRLQRNKRYIDYYSALKRKYLLFDDIWLADNASDYSSIRTLMKHAPPHVHMHRFQERLVRGLGGYDYPYCWRAIYFIQDLIAFGYKKIIAIDSDSFVVSKKMTDYINENNSGLYTFWSDKYRFPTAECYVLCEDSFPLFQKFCEIPWLFRVGSVLENEIPWTYVDHSFKCDRFGEEKENQTEDMDGYFQASTDQPIFFRQ